jgi:RimJ/RimL family protein N-acetyltransferase
MTGKPLFRGKRVRLAAPAPEDAQHFARWNEDSDFMRQMDTDYVRPRTVQDQEEMIKSMRSGENTMHFHIRTLDDDRLLGFVVIHSIEWNNQTGLISIGIGDPEYRGKGYGSEAMRLAMHYAFNELNLYRLGLDVIANNERAVRAYEKLGFRHEGAMRQSVYRDGVRVDRLIMGILRDEWEEIAMDEKWVGEEKGRKALTS